MHRINGGALTAQVFINKYIDFIGLRVIVFSVVTLTSIHIYNNVADCLNYVIYAVIIRYRYYLINLVYDHTWQGGIVDTLLPTEFPEGQFH